MALTLYIGNKNYSSWSFRPWIGLRAIGIAFDEVVIPLHGEGSKESILKVSPGGKVPVLVDGDLQVWESTAILEHCAERFPESGLLPADRAARAHARSTAAEMHSGFAALRSECPMNMRRPVRRRALSEKAAENVRRIDAMWTECRSRFGAGGPFLYGRFCLADAMYAPVVARFHTYDVAVGPSARAYMAAVMALPAWRDWSEAAATESWIIPHDEVDWPDVLTPDGPKRMTA